MKYALLATLSSILLASTAFAEEAPCPPDDLGDNFRFTLTYDPSNGQDHPIVFVTSAKSFRVSTVDPRIFFGGTIVKVDRSSLILQYSLKIDKQVVSRSSSQSEGAESTNPFQTVRYEQSELTSSVRLEFGTKVNVLESGGESAYLEVAKVE